jgi:xanthine dehydrogenase accessory factor
MREIIADVLRWEGLVAVATVVETWGSAPRQAGAKFAFTPDHRLTGSVSGGCIEGAVFEEGLAALETGVGRLVTYGVADETAFEAVGLACGGSIAVFVEMLTPELREFWRRAHAQDAGASSVTVISGTPENVGFKLLLSDDGVAVPNRSDERYNALAVEMLTVGRLAIESGSAARMLLPSGNEVFVDVVLPPPQIILVGGVHIALALSVIAQALGYRVIVIDPREAFGNRERFPAVHRLINAHPKDAFDAVSITRSTAIVTLTHDAKFDDVALDIALRSPAFYVGALGGKTTRAKRRERLAKAGLSVDQIERLHAPIGLDIGARTPEEIALATMAQVVAVRSGKLL